MMIHFLRDQGCARHKAEGLIEILEYEFFCNCVAASRLGPAVEPRQRRFTGFSGEFLRHDTRPSCNERVTLAKGPGRYYLLQGNSGHTRHPMSWSLNIGKLAGTVVRVHTTFLLLVAWTFA